MATNQTHANADRQPHPLLDKLREMHAAAAAQGRAAAAAQGFLRTA